MRAQLLRIAHTNGMGTKGIVMEGVVNSMERGIGAGILPSQEIRKLLARGEVHAEVAIPESHVQPASLDLRLGGIAPQHLE